MAVPIDRNSPEWQQRYERHVESVRGNVEKYGWSIQAVFPTEDDPGVVFAYTIGLIGKGCVCELLIAQLPFDAMATLLNQIAASMLENGGVPPSEWPMGDSEYMLRSVWVPGPDAMYPLGMAGAYYGVEAVPAIQYVWPGREHQYPWDESWPEEWVQPVGGAGRPHR